MRDCFGDETLGVSAFMTSLKSWIERDLAKGLEYLLLNGQEPRVLENVVDLLLQRKSRVWARVFLEALSDCVGLQRRLFAWAQDLNEQGEIYVLQCMCSFSWPFISKGVSFLKMLMP